MNKIFLFNLIFIILVSLNISYCADDEDDYSDSDFYKTSNPSSWDYSQVDWSKVDFSRTEIYSSEEFYKNIPSDAYNELDYTQLDYSNSNLDYTLLDYNQVVWSEIPSDKIVEIPTESLEYSQLNSEQRFYMSKEQVIANLNNIEDLYNDVNVQTVQLAIYDKFGISTEILSGAIIDSNGILSSKTNSQSITLINSGYQQGIIQVDKDGNIIFIAKASTDGDSNPIEILETDSFLLNSVVDGISYSINGEEVSLAGNVYIEQGNIFLLYGNSVIINNVEIVSKNDVVKVVFSLDDISNDDENYVVLDFENRRLETKSTNGQIDLDFYSENIFFNVEENDALRIELIQDVSLSVQNRESEGLIPAVNIKSLSSESEFIIFSGLTDIYKDSGDSEIYSEISKGEYFSSVPMTISIENEDGEVYDERYIISNYNEIGVIEDYSTEGKVLNKELILSSKAIVSERIDFNYNLYTEEYLQDILNNLGVNIEVNLDGLSDESKEESIKKIVDMLNTIPSTMLTTINKISILDADSFSEEYEGAMGLTSQSREIVLSESMLDIETFYHESVHTVQYYLLSELEKENSIKIATFYSTNSDFKALYEEYFELQKVNKQAFTDSNSDEIIEADNRISEISTKLSEEYNVEIETYYLEYDLDYFEQYSKINDITYYDEDSDSAIVVQDEDGLYKYKNGQDYDTDQNGVTNAYGASSIWEAQTTLVEPILNDPDVYDSKINPDLEDQSYVRQFAFATSYSYDGITYNTLPEGWLEKQMTEAGYDSECIEDVINGAHWEAECIQ